MLFDRRSGVNVMIIRIRKCVPAHVGSPGMGVPRQVSLSGVVGDTAGAADVVTSTAGSRATTAASASLAACGIGALGRVSWIFR